MRLLPLLFLTAQALSSSAHAADVVLTMNSYGPIRIGMTVAEVHRLMLKLGRKPLSRPDQVAKTGCDYYQGNSGLRFMVEDGKIVRIETQEPNVATPSGIRVGTSLDKVRRLLGSRLEDNQEHYSEDPKDRTLLLVSGDKQYGIRVDGNEIVTEMYAGAEHALRYVEGCA